MSDASCVIARSLDEIGDVWTLLIIKQILFGKGRFGEIQKEFGASRNTLATRLRILVAAGIVVQHPAANGTKYLEYALTQKGRELGMVVLALRIWGTNWLSKKSRSRLTSVDKATGQAVRLELRTQDGRLLDPVNTTIAGKRAKAAPRSS